MAKVRLYTSIVASVSNGALGLHLMTLLEVRGRDLLLTRLDYDLGTTLYSATHLVLHVSTLLHLVL